MRNLVQVFVILSLAVVAILCLYEFGLLKDPSGLFGMLGFLTIIAMFRYLHSRLSRV